MRVLLVHNFHRTSKPSGEDVAYRRERDLLRETGVDLHVYERTTDEAAEFGPADYLYLATHLHFNKRVYRDFRAHLQQVRPDLVHVHNTFPLLSSAIHGACHDLGIPVIQTLHNHYLFCARATCDRDGRPCELCLTTRNPLHAIRFGCYGGSRLANVPMVRMIHFNWIKGYWRDHIDAFIALTQHGRGTFIRAGLPADRLFVKPNFLPDPLPSAAPAADVEPYAVFIGRLTEEKGIDVLLDAAERLTVPIKIVGGSPNADHYERRARALPHVELLGTLPQTECFRLIRQARCLVAPSVCPETFGLTLIEAFAHGVPVVATRLGSFAELVQDGHNGITFPVGDAPALARAIQAFADDAELARRMGDAARISYTERYTPEVNARQLLTIYDAVLAGRAAPALPTDEEAAPLS